MHVQLFFPVLYYLKDLCSYHFSQNFKLIIINYDLVIIFWNLFIESINLYLILAENVII